MATHSNGWVGPMNCPVFGKTAYQRWAYTKASTPDMVSDRYVHEEDECSELNHSHNRRI